ncbi:MAG: TraR/DksA family transcriptional regulator [Hyphomicrobiales bacterium]
MASLPAPVLVIDMLDDKQIEDFGDALLKLQRELQDQSGATEDARKPVELDQQAVGRLSRMDALQEQAMQFETERRRQLTLTRIETALKRIKEDEFGYCIACGEEIDIRRLDNDPTLATCVKCASKGH